MTSRDVTKKKKPFNIFYGHYDGRLCRILVYLSSHSLLKKKKIIQKIQKNTENTNF